MDLEWALPKSAKSHLTVKFKIKNFQNTRTQFLLRVVSENRGIFKKLKIKLIFFGDF